MALTGKQLRYLFAKVFNKAAKAGRRAAKAAAKVKFRTPKASNRTSYFPKTKRKAGRKKR